MIVTLRLCDVCRNSVPTSDTEKELEPVYLSVPCKGYNPLEESPLWEKIISHRFIDVCEDCRQCITNAIRVSLHNRCQHLD